MSHPLFSELSPFLPNRVPWATEREPTKISSSTMEKKTPPRSMRSSPPVAYLQRHTQRSIAELALPLSDRAPTDDKNYQLFIMALFSRIRSSIWYNIIPFDPNDVYDMSTSMGQRWDHVLTLLFKADYLIFKKSQLSINTLKWQKLRLLQEGADMIQICSYRPYGKNKVWYVCKGSPKFKSPSQQIKNVNMDAFAHLEMHLPTRRDLTLKNRFCDYFI